MTVHILPIWIKNPYDCPEVSTVSSTGDYRHLSPFLLPAPPARNLENLWQYSKVYEKHVHLDNGEPTLEWFKWRDIGWANPRAVRYPMGKGAKPEYSYWNGEKLSYIEARKEIYATEYAKNVEKTITFARLVELYDGYSEITLKDYDAYDHIKMGMSLVDVINNPDRKMGHAFVLAMMLEGKLKECLNS